MLLAIDDAHWADRPSLRFLRFLLPRLEDLPLLLAVLGVALLRAGEAPLANPQASVGASWRVKAAWSVAPRSTDTWAAQATLGLSQ